METAKINETKTRKSSIEASVKTQVVEELYLTKIVKPIRSERFQIKKGMRYVIAYYSWEVSVADQDSPYSNIVCYGNSESDAIKKFNNALYEEVKRIDPSIIDKKRCEIVGKREKNAKRSKNASSEERSLEESIQINESSFVA
ncbi:MAG: hypothetical protein MJ057_01585 [Sphaerochaetaceae bacterium]|nr:hypothetical protein [Sphaerochaetaceae bacterium]